MTIKGALDKYNIIHQPFPKKVGIFISLEVLAWVITACQVLRTRLTNFWRSMSISSIFYFLKSTSINTQYSSLRDTLKMMLFTKHLIKWKYFDRISWKFQYWFNLKSTMELDVKRLMSYLSNAPLTSCKCKWEVNWNFENKLFFVYLFISTDSCLKRMLESLNIPLITIYHWKL